MSNYFMSIDPGKDTLKSIGRKTEGTAEDIKRVSFKTKIYNMADGYIDIEGNSHKVEYDGQTFIVGEQGEVSDDAYETSKTSSLHQLCSYAAISQYLEPNTTDNKISIVLACPISVLKVESAKEEYKNFIKNTGTIKIKVDDKNYTFDITDITIKAEDTGIKYSKPELFENTTVALIGFGGLNMNFQLFRNGVCKSHDRFAEEFGATTLTTYVKEDLTGYRKGNIVNFDEAEEALDNGYSTKDGEIDSGSIAIIKKSKLRFVNDALKIISRNGYQLDSIKKIVFVGGTINKFDDILKNLLPHSYVADDSQWATADGLYRVAAAKNLKN